MRRTRRAWGLALAAVTMGFAAPAAASSDPLRPAQWTLDRIGAEAAWSRSTGAGVLVAVIDTGVDAEHEDLRTQLEPGIDLVTPGGSAADDHGHGTAVAGVIAAATGNGLGIGGTAPGARLLPVRAFDGRTTIDETVVAWAIRASVVEAQRRRVPLVVNLSLADMGGLARIAGTGEELETAVREAHAAGAVVVFAAGSAADSLGPRLSDVSLWVGASDLSDRRTVRTFGAPHLLAPGTEVLSTTHDPQRRDSYSCDETCSTGTLSGTSYAAGYVSGAAAVLMALGLDNDAVARTLLDTAHRPEGSSCTPRDGCGRLDVAAAVDSVPAQPVAAPPAPIAEPATPDDDTAPIAKGEDGAVPTAERVTTRPAAEHAAEPATVQARHSPARHGADPAAPVARGPLRTATAAVLLTLGVSILAWGVVRPSRLPLPALGNATVPALDGLRGLAAAWVVALHAVLFLRDGAPQNRLLEPLLAGDLGVDLFFVLSGFLLLRTWQSVRATNGLRRAIGDYARRRALRILPAFWVSVAVLVPLVAPSLITDGRWRDIGMFATVQQFLGRTLPWEVNGVTWSLTTEVHFYAVLPLAVALMVRAGPARTLAGLVATSVAWRVWTETGAHWPSDLLPGRIDQFAAGMAAAWAVALPIRRSGAVVTMLRSRPGAVATFGLLAVVVVMHGSVINLAGGAEVPWQMIVHPIVGLLLAALLVRVASAARSPVLSSSPLRGLGRISYSLYLWHLPFLALTRWWQPGRSIPGLAALVAAGLIVSIVSYAAVERRFLRRRADVRHIPHPEPARVRAA